MIDPGTGIAILGSAIGGAKVVEKILGPSAGYLGDQLKLWTEKAHNNVSRIFKSAEEKLGDEINQPGAVPPKVLKGIIDHGAWSEEDLQVSYYGGVLASSRSGTSRDDRGAYFVGLVSSLSTYQLRTHYLIYSAIRQNFAGLDINIRSNDERIRMTIYIPIGSYNACMDFSAEELPNKQDLRTHAMTGLDKRGLIHSYQAGPVDSLKPKYSFIEEGGIIVTPSILGIELFMWANGHGRQPIRSFLSKNTQFELEEGVQNMESRPTTKV